MKVLNKDGKPFICPECGGELEMSDLGIEPENGDIWCDVSPCENPDCRRVIYESKLNPKYTMVG